MESLGAAVLMGCYSLVHEVSTLLLLDLQKFLEGKLCLSPRKKTRKRGKIEGVE